MGVADKFVFGGEKDEAGLSLLTKQLFPTVSRHNMESHKQVCLDIESTQCH